MRWRRCLYRWVRATALAAGALCGLQALAGMAPVPAPASTPASVAAKPATCAFGAFVTESDPAGLNVRSAPGLSGKVLGRLPAVFVSKDLDGFQIKVEVQVTAAQNGWFLISQARDNTALMSRPARKMFGGQGWVSGNKLTVKSQATQAHARPDPGSTVVFRLNDGSTFDSDAMVSAARLLDCRGPWALLELNTERLPEEMRALVDIHPSARVGSPPGRFKAWFGALCATQETSCDGLAAPAAAPGGSNPAPARPR